MIRRAWNVRVALLFALLMLIFIVLSVALRAQVTVNIAAVVGVLVSAAMLYQSLAAPPTEEKINSAVTDLAVLLEYSWGDRMALLLGRDEDSPAASRPLPASVRFTRVTGLELASQPGLAAGGSWRTIYEKFYRDIRGGRLVIVGEPGYGKTLLAIELVLQILLARRAGDPAAGKLPVPVSVAGWDGTDDLTTWLTRRLEEEWHLTPVIGRMLIQRHLILPVLDGLDEIGTRQTLEKPPDQQLRVLRQLNKTYGSSGEAGYVPVIVTCRTDDYRQLKGAAGGLLGAVVVEIQPLDRALIKEYLLARFDPGLTLPSADGAQWRDFADRIHRAAPGVLEACLASPWYLSLAISACRAGETTVGDLESFRDMDELEGYLTESSIPAAVRLHPRGTAALDAVAQESRRERRAGMPRGLYDPEDIRTWLGTLAEHLDWQACHGMPANSIDLLTLWRLAEANGGRPRLAHTVIGVAGGILAGLLGGELAGGMPGILTMTMTMTIGIGFGLWAGLRPDPGPSRVTLPLASETRGQAVIALAALTGILGGIGGQLIGHEASIGVAEGVSASFAVLVLAGLGGRQIKALQPRDALRTDLTFGLTLGIVYAAVGGLPGGLTGGILSHLHLNHYLTVPGSIILALILGLTAGVALGSRCWLRYAISTTIEAVHHRIPLRLERFMDWAYGASLLRITGVSYQFRHDKLKSSLTSPSPQ
jgi:hypothetical protein